MLSSLMVLSSSAICAAVNISTASAFFPPEKSGGESSAAVANRANGGLVPVPAPDRGLVYIERFKSSRTHLDREYHNGHSHHVFEATI
jgi:hypothetical protein